MIQKISFALVVKWKKFKQVQESSDFLAHRYHATINCIVCPSRYRLRLGPAIGLFT